MIGVPAQPLGSKLIAAVCAIIALSTLGIARRSAVERGILMTRNAPLSACCRNWSRCLPSMGHTKRALVRAGFLAGDALRCLQVRRRRRCDRRSGVERKLLPTVRQDGLDGGLLAYDGQLIDDAGEVAAHRARHPRPSTAPASSLTWARRMSPAFRWVDRPAHPAVVRCRRAVAAVSG